MEFKQLQSFVAVVQYRSFTLAADRLYISQPTISTHIRQLEEEFQSRLIIRTTKSIEVTPRGQELFQMASHMLAMRDSLTRRWIAENQSTVLLGASTIPSAYILPEILPAYRRLFPQVQFTIHQSDSQGILDGLLCDSFEVGLVGMETPVNGIAFLPFYQDSMVVITPVQERFLRMKEAGALRLETLLTEPIILREQGSGSKKCMESYFEQMGIRDSDLNVTARLNDQESIKHLVAGGLGISIISEKAACSDQKEGKLLTFSLPGASASRMLYLAYRKEYLFKSHTRQFIEFAKDFYR